MANETSSWNIDVRLRLLVASVLSTRNDWKQLELLTGVGAEKWRQWHRGTTNPSIFMIESVCRAWPQYAFWLTTGLTDPYFGHRSAMTPALGFPFSMGTDRTLAVHTEIYFKESLEVLQRVSALYLDNHAKAGSTSAQIAMQLEDDMALTLDSLQQELRLGSDERKAVAQHLLGRLRERIEDVISGLRGLPWVDAEIDRQRESDKEAVEEWEAIERRQAEVHAIRPKQRSTKAERANPKGKAKR